MGKQENFVELLKTFAKQDWMMQVKSSPPRIKRKRFSLKERTKKYENELSRHEEKKIDGEWCLDFFTPFLFPPTTFYIHSREIAWLEQNGFQ